MEEMRALAVVGVGDTALLFLSMALLPAPSHLQDRQKGFVNRKRSWSYKSTKPVETGVVGSGRLQKKLKMSQCVKNWEEF